MDQQELIDELTNDPKQRGYDWPDKSNGDVYRLLNEPYTEGFAPVGSRALMTWAGLDGRLAKLQDAANDHQDIAVRSIAGVAVKLIDRPDATVDLRRQEHRDMLDALVGAGVFDGADKTSLEALATEQVSRAYELWGRGVTIAEIRAAKEAVEA